MQLSRGGRIDISVKNKKLILKIDDCTVDDDGIYVVKIGDIQTEAKLTVNEMPIVFKRPLEDQRAKEGQSCVFECTLNRLTDKPVNWYVNGKMITKDEIKSGKYIVTQEKTRLQLKINNLDLAKDNGCEISCQIGDKAKSNKAKLSVEEEDINFIERLVDTGAKENDSPQFVCKLSKLKYITRSNQELTIKWFLKGKEIDFKAENSRFSFQQIDTVLKLNINAVHAEDAGEIKCQVNGDIYTVANLAVEEEPVVFVKKLEDVTCNALPGKACFECELNKSFVNVKWYKNGKEIGLDDSKYDIIREGTKHYLHVKDVDGGKDEGEYSIVLQGPHEKKCMAKLTVHAAPKLFLSAKFNDKITIKRGDPIDIEVAFAAHPEPKLTWAMDDGNREFVKDPRVKADCVRNKLASLLVKKTTRSDTGKYTLTLENEWGRETCSVKVTVLDRPSLPLKPVVTDVLANEMRFSWEKPKDDGGSPITVYIVEMKDFNKRTWTELTTTNAFELSTLVTRLDAGTRYSFRVSAENKYGRSEPAEIKDPVEAKNPFNPPDAPQNCQVKNVTTNSCLITFEPPLFDGGSPVTGYFIEKKQNMGSRWYRVNRESTSNLELKINDLLEGDEYVFRVIAENKAGPGAPSEPCKSFKAKNPFDKPGPPLNLKPGEITNTSIELNWDPPLSDGGSPITGYKLEQRNPKTMKWQSVELGPITQTNCLVPHLKEGHEYEFRVIATNKAGDGEPSASTPLLVAKTKIVGDKPIILEPMRDIRVLAGETAKFKASFKAKPPPSVKWSVDERVISSRDDAYTSTFDVKNNTVELEIPNAQLKDQGVYKVTVTNPLGECTTDAKLTVLMKPSIKYDSKLDKVFEVVAIQQNLNITCEVKGWPKPDVKWLKDKQPVTPDVSRAITDFGELFAMLTLKKIKREEGGSYTIIAENEVGRSEANFVIRVLDVPMPPENLTVAEISSYSCKLKWSPPKDDGNVPIIGYYIEKLDPKRGSYIRLDKTSLTEHYIDKLEKGHSYQFRVIAENRIGLSEPCEMQETVVAKGKFDLPGVPGVPEISEINQAGCRVAWEAPKKDGGTPIRGYFVEKKSGSKWIRVNKEPISARYIILKDLSQGNDYEFRVCAVNDEGEGLFSKVTN